MLIGGLKRTSPAQHHNARPAKMHHYNDMHDTLMSSEMIHSGRQSASLEPLMSPEINSMTSDDRNLGRQSRQDDGM